MATTESTRRAALVPLATPAFRVLWLGQSLFSLGVQFYTVALIWLVLRITGSGVELGTVLMVAAIPRAAAMLVSGGLADRVQPRLLLALSALGSATLVGSIALLLAIDGMDLLALYAIAALLGLMDALFYPTALAQVARLVASERLGAANALISTSDNIANILGPALSGFVISRIGLAPAFGLNTLLFAIGSLILWQLRRRPPAAPATDAAPETFGGAIRTGWRFAWGSPAIRVSLILMAMVNFAALGPIVVGLAVLAEQRFGGDAALYGLLTAAFGGGALLGGIAAGALPAIRRPGRVLAWLALGLGGGLIVLGLAETLALALAVLAVSGLGVGIVGVVAVSWLQARTPPELQGRMASLLIFALVAVDPLSNALAGLLIEISAVALFVTAGALMLLTGLVALRSRAMEREAG